MPFCRPFITAGSDAIEKYCRRDFLSTAYDELVAALSFPCSRDPWLSN
jgi:hypothetical protein